MIAPSRPCSLCGHREDQHETLPDGTRPCRSIGHPKGLTCRECQRLISPEYVESLQELRAADDAAFEEAWSAYRVTLDHARDQVGPGWAAFFTDVHQSALASAVLTLRAQSGFSCPLPQCGWTWTGPVAAVEPQPTPFARPRELADGVGVWPSRAVSRLVSTTEEGVRLHLDAHSLEAWVAALRLTQAVLEECTGCGGTGACAGGPCAHPNAAKSEVSWADPGDEAWGSVWLRGSWRSLTRQMTTPAREHAAGAVLRWMHALDAIDGRPAREAPEELRWWREAKG